MWNRPPDFTPIEHFSKKDPRNIRNARERLKALQDLDANGEAASTPCLPLYLKPNANAIFTQAARNRGLSRDVFIRMLLLEIAANPGFVDKILAK